LKPRLRTQEPKYKRFCEIALKSANETKYWLGLLRDSGKADKEKTNEILREVTEIAKILAFRIITLKKKKF